MEKLTLALKSRTVWTVVATVVMNSLNANMQFIPSDLVPYVNGLLALAAMYFHVNPSQNYTPKA
jgi:hypothetical protein